MNIFRRMIERIFGQRLALSKYTFARKPSIYKRRLARAAAAICLDNTSEGEGELKNLKRIGFDKENIKVVNLDSDTIIYAQKLIRVSREQRAIKVVSIRGSDVALSENAFDDWVNNFKVGKLFKGKTHKGFEETAEKLFKSAEFKTLIGGSQDAIYLVVGHSRGGAIAAEIVNHLIKEVGICANEVFGYTFGAPSTIRGEPGKDKRIGELTGLHQVENENDKVPALPPQMWGWASRGIVHTISFPGNVLEAHSLEDYLRFA